MHRHEGLIPPRGRPSIAITAQARNSMAIGLAMLKQRYESTRGRGPTSCLKLPPRCAGLSNVAS
eukprot:697531-Alexandrium_andersonii.AAC.1